MTKRMNLFLDNKISNVDCRKIPLAVKDTILGILNESNSEMVAIYGSYGTERQHEDSDIDIAWLPKKDISYMECNRIGNSIAKALKSAGHHIEVDLKTLGSIYPVCLEEEMMSGTILFSINNYGIFLANYDALNYPMLFVTHKGDWYYD